MRYRNLVLGSTASLAIAGALFAAPCFAQTQSRYSTPSEQAQTDGLNAQQASEPGIIVSTAAVETSSQAADVAAYNASVAQDNAQAQAQYEAQLRDYQDKKNVFDAQRRAYREELKNYRDHPVVVEEHHVIVDSPAVVTVDPRDRRGLDFPGRDRSLVSFDDIANPDREIGGTAVEDRAGHFVGHFKFLTFQDPGHEKAVIMLRNNKSIAIDDAHLRFDSDRDTVVADMSFDELNRMPARF
jgi:hypothetical protein